jgi:uroporphyrinogen decarboxylase
MVGRVGKGQSPARANGRKSAVANPERQPKKAPAPKAKAALKAVQPETPPFLEALAHKAPARTPVWLMRQAGRYLPEYRETRTQAGSFLDLCYNPKLAAEVTLQPIRRFGFDASIIFSDILVVPHALGQKVEFLEGEGPRLEPITSAADLNRLDPAKTSARFDLVYEAIGRVVAGLGPSTPLIGFCGAPWTVATYMVGGGGSPDQRAAKTMAFRDPKTFATLIGIVVEASAGYLSGQVKAGVRALQIFDSWAGSLADNDYEEWVIAPTVELVRRVREAHPDVPVIGFPRGNAALYSRYLDATGVQGIGCDTAAPLSAMAALQARAAVQGNLDPILLVAGGNAMERRVAAILQALAGSPFIFNLGHGILPDTPIPHVERLMELIRGHKS